MVDKRKVAAATGPDEEEAFPRGGGQGLAPVVQKRLEKVPGAPEIASHSEAHPAADFPAGLGGAVNRPPSWQRGCATAAQEAYAEAEAELFGAKKGGKKRKQGAGAELQVRLLPAGQECSRQGGEGSGELASSPAHQPNRFDRERRWNG
jgi:hypothetical protein